MNTNYETAITLLQECYGKKQMVQNAHNTHLMYLTQASNNTSSLRATYDAAEDIHWGKMSITGKLFRSYERNCQRWSSQGWSNKRFPMNIGRYKL